MRSAFLAGFAAALSAAISAEAQVPAVPPTSPAEEPRIEVTETLDLLVDRTERMTVPVSIGGQGPYSFIVDTGSERTVIASELAQRLGLGPGRTATVFSMTEASRIDTVVIPALEVGQRTVNEIHAPALARTHIGAEGLLGVDSLRSQRVELDFRRQQMTVTPSRSASEHSWPTDTIIITARRRHGQLMITDASFEGQRIVAIIDTGAEVTIGNNALRRRLERSRRLGMLQPIEIISVTGGRLRAEYGPARHIQVGGATINNLMVAFADVHPFRQLRLMDRPAILIGMDALRLFERVSVDFGNRRVRMVLPATAQTPFDFSVARRSTVRTGRPGGRPPGL